MSLSELSVRRPVFATMLVMSLVVLGIFAFRDLGVDLFPKADPATVTVTVMLPGASPAEMATSVVEPLEEALSSISGIDEMTALIREATAIVPGLDGQKMSKSYGNSVGLFEEEKALKKKIMGIGHRVYKVLDPRRSPSASCSSATSTTPPTTFARRSRERCAPCRRRCSRRSSRRWIRTPIRSWRSSCHRTR